MLLIGIAVGAALTLLGGWLFLAFTFARAMR